jgi:hypothetical protein
MQFFLVVVVYLFETVFHYVAQAALELVILLPQPLECCITDMHTGLQFFQLLQNTHHIKFPIFNYFLDIQLSSIKDIDLAVQSSPCPKLKFNTH